MRRAVDFPAFLDRLAKHFPGLTPADREIRQATGSRLPVWQNTVEWTRNRLRARGELDSGQFGVWAITESGKHRLRADLQNLGLADVEGFIRSAQSIPEVAGAAWQPQSLRRRQRRPQAASAQAPTPVSAQQTQPPIVQSAPRTSEPPGGQRQPAGTEQRNTDRIKSELNARLQSLAPPQFERLIGEFLKVKGLAEVEVTGRTGDGGIDGEAKVPFLKLACAFQAKRYAPGNSVGAAAVRNFKGGVVGRYDRGILITTSNFTEGAKEEAGEPGVTIVLIDGDQLVDSLLNLGLGIKTIPVVEQTVDVEFFDRLAQ